MATHSSILAWEIPWTEKPGGLHTSRGIANRHNRTTEREHARTHTYTHTQLMPQPSGVQQILSQRLTLILSGTNTPLSAPQARADVYLKCSHIQWVYTLTHELELVL